MAARIRAHIEGNVVDYATGFIALGGTSAAATFEKNQVKSKQIKKATVKTKDLAAGLDRISRRLRSNIRCAAEIERSCE